MMAHTEYFTGWWVLAISTNEPMITQNTWKSYACLSHLRMLISHVVIRCIMLLSNRNLVERVVGRLPLSVWIYDQKMDLMEEENAFPPPWKTCQEISFVNFDFWKRNWTVTVGIVESWGVGAYVSDVSSYYKNDGDKKSKSCRRRSRFKHINSTCLNVLNPVIKFCCN